MDKLIKFFKYKKYIYVNKLFIEKKTENTTTGKIVKQIKKN